MSRWHWFSRSRCSPPRFALGQILITAAAREALQLAQVPAGDLLRRHARGDWGQVDELDRKQNELGLRLGLRLRSVYAVQSFPAKAPRGVGVKTFNVWVITRPNRSQTTILLPSEIFDAPRQEDDQN